jgi:hypothetical protein
MDHSLSMLAINVNGLRDNKKRRDFLLRLLKAFSRLWMSPMHGAASGA